MNVLTGDTSGRRQRYAIVVRRFNELVTERLLTAQPLGYSSQRWPEHIPSLGARVRRDTGGRQRCAATGKYAPSSPSGQ